MTAYHQVPHILYQASWKHVEQAVHAQLANVGKVYQITTAREEAGNDYAEQTA